MGYLRQNSKKKTDEQRVTREQESDSKENLLCDLFMVGKTNVIATWRITNYLFQDDEENFDDLFQMKYNLVALLFISSFFYFYFFFAFFLYFGQSYLSTFESKKLSLILIVKDGHSY